MNIRKNGLICLNTVHGVRSGLYVKHKTIRSQGKQTFRSQGKQTISCQGTKTIRSQGKKKN